MQTILVYLVSGWDFIYEIFIWQLKNPAAWGFWAGFWFYILDRVVAWTPTKIDDSLVDILKRAIDMGFQKAREKLNLPK